MIVETKYDVGDPVKIVGLENHPGVVQEVRLAGRLSTDLLYLVAYWWQGSFRSEWLLDAEIISGKEKP